MSTRADQQAPQPAAPADKDGAAARIAEQIRARLAMPPLSDAETMKATRMVTAMRDGVRLVMDVYLPAGDGPWPVALQRTPYNRREPYMFAPFHYLLEAGYAFAVQDCRGRFESEGVYRPFLDDLDDGFDTVEWLASQPWSTGRIGMVGTSAMGITAYLAAMSGAPHLLAGAVTLSRNPNQQLSRFPGGIFLESNATMWDKAVAGHEHGTPVPHLVSDAADEKRFDLRDYFTHINTPFLHLGGWFDTNLQSTLQNFNGLQDYALPPARGNQKLIMGALGHMGAVEGVQFPGETGDRFLRPQTVTRWFDHWLKGEDNGVPQEPAVRYYLMGDTTDAAAPGNTWREVGSWPPVAEAYSLHLQNDGSLEEQPAGDATQHSYVYDPADAVPTVGGNNLFLPSGPMDQRAVSQRPDVLRFVGPALTEPMEIAGAVTAELWVSTDAEDTDYIVKLIDIHPDGLEALIRDGGLRLRHRHGLDKQDRAEPGTIYSITVDLWSTALVVNKGHRLGLLIQSSNWPRFERHTNTWEPVANYDAALKALNTVYTGPQHTSRLVLPLRHIDCRHESCP